VRVSHTRAHLVLFYSDYLFKNCSIKEKIEHKYLCVVKWFEKMKSVSAMKTVIV